MSKLNVIKALLPLFVCTTFFVNPVKAQLDEGQFMAEVSSDLYRTDNRNPFQVFKRFGVGLDLHYFPADKFAFGAGGEYNAIAQGGTRFYWTTHLRYYLVGKAFLRVRSRTSGFFNSFGLMLGAGYDFFLSDHWALELTGDYYLIEVNAFGFRGGINWFIK